MNIRKANESDIESIMLIINQSKQDFKDRGLDQWQHGYPNSETIVEDISNGESYVIVDNDIVVGTFMLSYTPQDNYESDTVVWNSKGKYSVIHRIAISMTTRNKGYASQCLNYAYEKSRNDGYETMRIDTHQDNEAMLKFLLKEKFVVCGTITVSDGERIALDRNLV